jgi:integrase
VSIRKRTWFTGPEDKRVKHEAWVVDYTSRGKRHLRTFATRKAADAWSVTARHEVSQGTHTAASTSITVAELVMEWIDHGTAEGLEHGTIVQRRQHFKLHINPFIGHIKLSALTLPMANKFDADLRDAGRSQSMRKKVRTTLTMALKYGMEEGKVSQNVAREMRRLKSDRGTAKLTEGEHFPSREELRLIMDRAPARWRPLFVTAVFSGLRASELRGLTWDQVKFDNGVILRPELAHVTCRWLRSWPTRSGPGGISALPVSSG